MRRSTLALVRRLVSGVRSSCAASCTSRSWASRAAARRASIVLNDADSRPTSSRPSTGTVPVDPPRDADLLRDAGEPHQPPGDAAGEQPARGRRGEQDREAHRRDLLGGVAEHPAGRAEVDGHLQRPAAGAERGRELAVGVAADRDLGGDRAPVARRRGEGPGEVGDGQGDGPAAEPGDRAVGGHGLGDQLRSVAASTAAMVARTARRRGIEHRGLAVDESGGDRRQRAVDLGGDPVRRGAVAERPDQHRDHGADEGEGQREPRRVRHVHGCRTAYPTPRTVWIRFGAPAAASLRRR